MAKKEQIERLFQSVEQWNKWRSAIDSNESIQLSEADLKGANLQRAKLREADLRSANLQEVNLLRATLRDAVLRKANLRGANLQKADLRGVKLRKANLLQADLRGANLQRANLARAYLLQADLRGVRLQGAFLDEAHLREVDLQGASLQDAYLREVDLQGADLKGADLKGVKLQGADLKGADLKGADLKGADLRRALNLECKQLTQAVHWEEAFRDAALLCGADAIPEEDISRESTIGTDEIDLSPGELGKSIRDEENANQTVHGRMRHVIDHLATSVDSLRALRLNAPEANEAISRLEEALEIAKAVERVADEAQETDELAERKSQLLLSLLDSLERFIKSEAPIRTTFLVAAVFAAVSMGAHPLTEVLIGVSAAGNKGLVKQARKLVLSWRRDVR